MNMSQLDSHMQEANWVLSQRKKLRLCVKLCPKDSEKCSTLPDLLQFSD